MDSVKMYMDTLDVIVNKVIN